MTTNKPHFSWLAIVKIIVFLLGIVAGFSQIGNTFANDLDCSTLTSQNVDDCCDPTSRGVSIDCSGKNISNIASDAFINYAYKKSYLYLTNNNLSNISFFSGLDEGSTFQNIYLEYNNISDISPLQGLKNITKLYLQGNRIQDISVLSTFQCKKHLTELNLSGNRISIYPSSLSNLEVLKNLFLDNNHISSIPNMPLSLINLYLSYNDIEELPDDFAKYTGDQYHLRSIDLRHNNISTIPQNLVSTLGYLSASLGNNCIDTEENSESINILWERRDIPIGAQRNCSIWTGQDVTLNFLEMTGSFDDRSGSCISDENVTPYFCIYTGDNGCEEYMSGTSYLVSCNSGEICQMSVNYFFIDNEGNACGTGDTMVQIDKKAPSCDITQNGEMTGNNIYRPTNQPVSLAVYPIDEGIGKIAYSGYKRNDEDRSTHSTTEVTGNGTYSIYIQDAVGNETGCSITVSNIDMDIPAPAVGNPSNCFSGNINVSFEESLHETGVGFGGSYIVYTTGGGSLKCNGKRWTNNIIFTETTSLTIGVCDEAGNINKSGYTYALDRAPITSTSGYNRQWTKNDVSLEFGIDDGHPLCRKSEPSKTYYCTYSSGDRPCIPDKTGFDTIVKCEDNQVCQKYIKYYSVNGSGMSESAKTGLILIDKEAPSCSIGQNPTAENYTNGKVTLIAIANDGIGSNQLQYNWLGYFGFTTTSGVSKNGTYDVLVQDSVGNEAGCSITVSNIDKVKPNLTITPANDNNTKKSRTISIIATDDLAGISDYQKFKYYRSDTTSCSGNEALYDEGNFEAYTLGDKTVTGHLTKSDGDGYKYLCILGGILDRAGNNSKLTSGGPYLFDNTGPTGNIAISYNGNPGYASGYMLSLALTGFDEYSTISRMQFSCDNSNWSEEESFNIEKKFNLSDYRHNGCTLQEGIKTIYVRYIDSLGNIGSSISGSIILDMTPPTCNIEQAACTSGDLELTLMANENIEIPNKWTKASNTIFTNSVTSNDEVTVNISDLAGNVGICSIVPTNYDKNSPTITFDDIETSECTSVNWTVNANDVGCAGIGNNAYNFSGTSFGNGERGNSTLHITSKQLLSGGSSHTQYVLVRDSLGNTNISSATLTILDTYPTIQQITGSIQGLLTGDTIYGDVVSALNVVDGACGTGTMTASLVGECTNATESIIENNILTIKPNKNIEGEGFCTIRFNDNELNYITGFVSYSIDTQRPEKAECTETTCFKNSISVSCQESGEGLGNKIVYSTNDNISCNSPTRSNRSFSSSTTLKVAVCDNVGHISDVSTYVYNIDNESPTTILSGLPIGWTGNNLNLGVTVQDDCIKTNTYYCLTGLMSECLNSNFQVLSGDTIDISCPDGELCEWTIRYYSVDGAGNRGETHSGVIQIDKKELTCEIDFDHKCTNTGITLYLSVSKPIINDLGGWRVSGNNLYVKNVYGNGDISVDVYDHMNNTYTCNKYVNTFDNQAPTVYTLDIYTGYECSDIVISPIVSNEGCAEGLTYIWNNVTGDTEYTLDWNNDNVFNINYTNLIVVDEAGNRTDKKIKYQRINIPISGQNFEVENVGTGITINWKESAQISAGGCETGDITANLLNTGYMGNCILMGDYLSYIPNEGSIGNDICILNISDGDSEISVSAIWKGIDNDGPIVTLYTGGFGNICTDQNMTTILLSFSESVNGITQNSLTGSNIEMISFYSGNNGSEYSWIINLTGEGTGTIWIDTGNIHDSVGNTLSGIIEPLYLGYYDVSGPSTPVLQNYKGGEESDTSSITLQWNESSTTGCASLEKYLINVCTDIDMVHGCKGYESYSTEKTIVKGNGTYYRNVIAVDTNGNESMFETGYFVINSNNPTCIIDYTDTCTSGNIVLTLSTSESINLINSGGITWIPSGINEWTGVVTSNMVISGIIIEDLEGNTGSCEGLSISSFDDIAPTTTISGDLTILDETFWAKDDIDLQLIGSDDGCGIDSISTYYCISDTDECEEFVQGTDIQLTGNDNDISKKYINFYSIDAAGNREASKSTVIIIDKQGPSCEINKNIDYKTNDSIMITLTGDDRQGIGVDQFPYAWHPEKQWISQNYYIVWMNGIYTGYIRDMLGNESTCGITIENIDKTSPKGAICESNACFAENISISCAQEENEDGNYIVYTVDGTNPSCTSNSGNQFVFDSDTVLKVAVCDSADNISEISTYTYIIDDEAPQTMIEGLPLGDNWIGSDVGISLSGNDFGCAGGYETYYCIYDSGQNCTDFRTGTQISIDCNSGSVCIKYIEYYSIDSVGNREITQKRAVNIDKQGPSCEIIQTPNSNIDTNGSVKLNVIADDLAGIKSYIWSGNLGRQKEVSVDKNGTYAVSVSDVLGNISECNINVTNIDKTKPQGVNCSTISCTSGSLNIQCNEISSESGNKIVYTTNGLSPNCESNIRHNRSLSGATTLKVAVCDKANNISEISSYNYTQTDFESICHNSTGSTGNTTGDNPGITTGDNPGITTGNNPSITTGDNPSITTGDNPSITTGDNPSITTGDHPGITTGDHPGITTGDNPGITTGNNPSITTGDNPSITTGDSLSNSGDNYCLASWNNDKFLDENFWSTYSGDNEIGHNQLICALYGYSGDYETAYTLGRSGYDTNSCTGMKVVETGILPSTMESNTIYVLTTGKIIVSHKISMEGCSAVISKMGTKIYSDKEFDEYHDATMIYTKGYNILDNIDIDGINNGTGGSHNRNNYGIDVASNSTLNNIKAYHNGHGILVGGSHININNAQIYGNDGAGIWESSHLLDTNTYNTYNNIQSYNNKDDGFKIRGLNSKLNNTMSYNNGNDSGSVSRNYMTNPKDINGDYLVKWTNSGFNNSKGLKTIGEIEGYSYGVGISTQRQPIIYKGTELITGGSYDINKYIGSNVSKITGATEILYTGVNGELIFISNSSNTGINEYSLFIIGNTNTGIMIKGIKLGESTGVANMGYQKVVTQLLGTGYFATHYENNILMNDTQKKYKKFIPDLSKYNWTFSEEMNEAYQYSYEYKITTMPSIASADMYGNLTRIAMAKMISNYAINILGEEPDYTKSQKFSDVSDTLDSQYDYGVQKAYQLGIMGQNMPNNEFRPYDLVTRAEFATALSRLLFNMDDGKKIYYEPHLYILNKLGIISDTNPNLQERRGYVMLMLLRYHQHNAY